MSYAVSGLGFSDTAMSSSPCRENETCRRQVRINSVPGLPSGIEPGAVTAEITIALRRAGFEDPRARWVTGGAIAVEYTVVGRLATAFTTERHRLVQGALSAAVTDLGPNVRFVMEGGPTIMSANSPNNPVNTPTISVRELQQLLLQKGFSVGASGADGVWGTNTRNALSAALGVPVQTNIPARATEIGLPAAELARLRALPDQPAGTAQPAAPRPSAEPIVIEEPMINSNAEEVAMQILPWAIGAVALVGIGGYFIWRGRRSGGGHGRMATANRRRRSRRRR